MGRFCDTDDNNIVSIEGLRDNFRKFRKNSAKAAIELYYGEETRQKVLSVNISSNAGLSEIKRAERAISDIMADAKAAFDWDDPKWASIPAELA